MPDKTVGTESFALEKKPEFSGKRLRMAFIGCGGIAATHMNALQMFPEVEVVAGVDIDPARLKVFEEKFGITRLYKDWTAMLKEVKPDAVNVCTPNALHAQPLIDACNAGAHAMVEKPMAMNPGECQRMIDAARKNDRKLAVGFQYRFHPATQYLVRARDEGTFGNVMFVKCLASWLITRRVSTGAWRCAAAAYRTGASSAARSSRAAGR